MTRADRFNEQEHQVCAVARMIEDGKTYWVAGGGAPLYALLIAKRFYAPNAIYITEDGVNDPQPMLPMEPIQTMVNSRAGYRAVQWGTMNTAGDYACLGYIDYGILDTLQVDLYGNLNSTWLGDYPVEGRRFGGPGGADSIAAMCWRTILMPDQEQRRFVPQLDFISSPGFLDGAPGARERAGLPKDTGPWRVVTSWAVFGYDEETRYLKLLAVAPFVTVEQVLAEMSFKPLLADRIETMEPPTEEELLMLRVELDTDGRATHNGRWVGYRNGRWAFLEE